VWNPYCVLFPDGSSAPFNESVRYTALTGYLRKKRVLTDGRAEFTLTHGESQRGWVRHFFHLSMKQLAWFDLDPKEAIERTRRHANEKKLRKRVKYSAEGLRHDLSAGKGVGSALLYTAPCRLYTSRLYRNEFALSFGNGELLTLQAADGRDAQQWVVALASCLYFASAAFEALIAECQRFFDAANKTIDGKLAPLEALDLVRAMGRRATYVQVRRAADIVCPDGGWFGPREFAFLVRSICEDADPRSELIRAFRLMDLETSVTTDGASGSASASATGSAHTSRDGTAGKESRDARSKQVGASKVVTPRGFVTISQLMTTMRAAGVPEDHVLSVVRATGADPSADQSIDYVQLANSFYPAAATAAKRREQLWNADEEAASVRIEAEARLLWEAQREEILLSALTASPGGRPLPVLISLTQPTTFSVPSGALGAATAPVGVVPGADPGAAVVSPGCVLSFSSPPPATATTVSPLSSVPTLGVRRRRLARPLIAPLIALCPHRRWLPARLHAPCIQHAAFSLDPPPLHPARPTSHAPLSPLLTIY